MASNFKKIGSGISLVAAAADPGTAVAGDMYYNSVSQTLKVYNGTSWASVVTGTAANTALSNLASVAINTSLLPASNNAIDLGSDALELSNLWAYALKHNDASTPTLTIATMGNNGSININANGTGNLDIQATKVRQSENGAGSNYFEQQYFDALSLSANISSETAISNLTFAYATYRGVIIDYMIEEATSLKTRTGRFFVACDGSSVVSSSDQYVETGVLGSASILYITAVINGANVEVRYNNTNASNACTMRCIVRRLRA